MKTHPSRLFIILLLLLLQACEQSITSEAQIEVTGEQSGGQFLLTDLKIKEIEQISVSLNSADPLVKLEHVDGQWQLMAPLEIPANSVLIYALLNSITNAKVLEKKTPKLSWYHHLGVNDVQQADASGVFLQLRAREKYWRLILGKKSKDQRGQYWRLLGSDRDLVVRVDQYIDLPRDALGWMNREIIDLPANGVASIKIEVIHGKPILLTRDNSQQALQTSANEQIELPHAVNQLVYGLSQLNFEAIDAVTETAIEEPEFRLIYVLFDGAAFELSLYPDAEGSWCRIRAIDSENVDKQNQQSELVAMMNRHLSQWRFHLSAQRTALFTQAINQLQGEVND